ncbi:unnamed protein product, partial [Anisakis simplex]|uniref:SGL domain-containing protein n=1 Tax=Anisakis simplex TaxID=6269 RepID=A0A0M3JDP1_ANISI
MVVWFGVELEWLFDGFAGIGVATSSIESGQGQRQKMTENLSNTSNHQRLDEMFIHLTPKGATVPYSLCVDSERNVWVASKGGLFKFDSTGKNLLFERRNPFPKKISPYCQVLYCDGK